MTTDLEQRLRGSADWPNSKGLTIVRPDYLIEAAVEIARLRAENEALRESLGPFARLGDLILAEAPAEAETIVLFTSMTGERFSMELDNFRRAAAALQEGSRHE